MANEGYIKLYRKMKKWGWYKDQNTKDVFLHLLLEACYEPCFYRNTYLEVGQVAMTVAEISEETGISVKSVRTSLNKLKSTNELAIKTTNKFSIFTLKNYSDYQGTDNNLGKRGANEGQTRGKRGANASYYKEDKEDKEVKNTLYERKKSGRKKKEIDWENDPPSFDIERIEEEIRNGFDDVI